MNEQQELSVKAYNLERKLSALRAELERIALSIVELEKAKLSIKNIGRNEVLMPIGAGVLARAQVISDKVFVPIGAGFYVVEDKEHAMDKIEELEENTKRIHEKVFEELKKAEKELLELMRRARESQMSQ